MYVTAYTQACRIVWNIWCVTARCVWSREDFSINWTPRVFISALLQRYKKTVLITDAMLKSVIALRRDVKRALRFLQIVVSCLGTDMKQWPWQLGVELLTRFLKPTRSHTLLTSGYKSSFWLQKIIGRSQTSACCQCQWAQTWSSGRLGWPLGWKERKKTLFLLTPQTLLESHFVQSRPSTTESVNLPHFLLAILLLLRKWTFPDILPHCTASFLCTSACLLVFTE